MVKTFGFFTLLLVLLFSHTALGSEAQVKKFCKENYGKKRTTFDQCFLSQKSAKKFIERNKTDDTIKQYCKKKNPVNWVKRKYCINAQERAKTEIKMLTADDLIKTKCKKTYGKDFVSQKNCIRYETESER